MERLRCFDGTTGYAAENQNAARARLLQTRRCRKSLGRFRGTLRLNYGGYTMSHHASGPDFGFPRGDARIDMTDLYAFSRPGDPSKSIIILNVHPSMAVNPMAPTTREPFAPGALYEIKVDTDGDATADVCC